ncbi:MAG: glucose-6-phosphate isomerase [Dehalococcoidia bacterium]|nr:glucose-6-phosphate isomerase [Dehalococcoidia bacterium]
MSVHLGAYGEVVSYTLRRLDAERVVPRIWDRDHTVWKPKPDGIADRLGWLDLPSTMREEASAITAFADEVTLSGFRHVVLFGMGGSSLAAEVLRQTCAPSDHPLKLIVLDSTIPKAVRETEAAIDPAHTLFIVSSKSGTTIEPNVLYRYFRDVVDREVGGEQAGANFVAITDSGTPLERLAQEEGFRRVFTPPSDVGGRYSALSHFGLLPAALAGADIRSLLDRGASMASRCLTESLVKENPGALLGAAMGALTRERRDKLTLIVSPSVVAFGMWVDQLIAESTGKDGMGIVPIVNEPLTATENYGDDRLFVCLRVEGDGDKEANEAMNDLRDHGHPVIVITLGDSQDLGGEFFRWEFATAVASSILGVQPFDQPNVQASKEQTLEVLEEIESTGELPKTDPTGSIEDLLRQARTGDYLAIMAYVRPTPATERALADLRRDVMERYKIATTLGYGPRLLHSTGQLHKRGTNTGLFLQIVSDDHMDVSIPGRGYSFGALATAQAVGDFRTLQRLGRRVIRVNANSIAGLD